MNPHAIQAQTSKNWRRGGREGNENILSILLLVECLLNEEEVMRGEGQASRRLELIAPDVLLDTLNEYHDTWEFSGSSEPSRAESGDPPAGLTYSDRSISLIIKYYIL